MSMHPLALGWRTGGWPSSGRGVGLFLGPLLEPVCPAGRGPRGPSWHVLRLTTAAQGGDCHLPVLQVRRLRPRAAVPCPRPSWASWEAVCHAGVLCCRICQRNSQLLLGLQALTVLRELPWGAPGGSWSAGWGEEGRWERLGLASGCNLTGWGQAVTTGSWCGSRAGQSLGPECCVLCARRLGARAGGRTGSAVGGQGGEVTLRSPQASLCLCVPVCLRISDGFTVG